ncbi:CPBP family intramembrane metalloprotease [Cryobacterium lactosi]|uniref:CPBP family intramembrane metalloprotease n=1 Tax=Cryobacterium lactosi TaxID=1259202 RepID=A0A4R9BNQ7_9MICO|nr:CPBP family intramembrane glutamic endopeptidase [Cryobacterium lactosi]TFD87005.1 CPBP family intramembrane metalloprotease [Cryobacterium lactosi]
MTSPLHTTLSDRPFGVHFRLPRWKSLIVLISVPVLLLLVQILVFQAVVMIEGPADPLKPRLTPLTILASGISTAITALIATMLVARLARVSWRSVFSHNRKFDWRRLGIYFAASVLLVGLSVVATALIAPESAGWGGFDVGATTIGIILVTLLAIPLQAAGEEVAFRGVVVPAAGSWFRGVRPAIVLGIILSGALFALVHVSIDPWFVSYLFVFSACTVLMGLISGGLEAAMALHVANNVLVGIINALFAGNDATVVDRAAGSGPGASLIILMVMNVAVLGTVWLIERKKRSATGPKVLVSAG